MEEGPWTPEVTADGELTCSTPPASQFRLFVRDHPDVARAPRPSLEQPLGRSPGRRGQI
jgi:hypothetical protein